MEILRAEQVHYSYQTKYQTIEAVRGVSYSFETGNMYAIVGESGSGKSTFLSLLAGLDLPTKGNVYVEGEDMAVLNRDSYRREKASVVYQSFNLFPLLTAQENVMFPIELKGTGKREAAKKAAELIERVGLREQVLYQFPQMMSGGEQQRLAIARAMAAGGKIILADEPTGNLDSENQQNIVQLLKEAAHTMEFAVIVITHNPEVAAEADYVLRMRDGKLIN
ncbi:MAG: transporter ATP-binding protein [Herbinix sp.]|jgi:putative ABC transport system ATP-binding protein|nr:transporter ATP-binding protein [Herbinix sp.]